MTIAPRTVAQSTLDSSYEPKVRRWIIPRLGKHRLDRLQPEHLDAFYSWLATQKLKPNTVLQIHRILSRALKVAWKRGKTGRNVAALIDAPVGEEIEIEPLTQREHARSSPPPRTGPAAFAGRSPWHSASARARPSACAGSTSTSTRAPSRSAGSSSGPATGTAAATQPRAPPAATAGPARRSAESTGTLTAARRTAASAATAAPR